MEDENTFREIRERLDSAHLIEQRLPVGSYVHLDKYRWTLHISREIGQLPWLETLGHGFGTVFSTYDINDLLGYFHERPGLFVPISFFKSIHFSIRKSLYDNNLSSSELSRTLIKGMKDVTFVGNTSFAMRERVYFTDQTDPFVTIRNLSVAIDSSTGRPTPFSEVMKTQCLDLFRREGVPNKKPDFIPFPAEAYAIHESVMTVTEDCIDDNNHSNYKMYFIKAFDSIKQMYKDKVFYFKPHRSFAHCRVKEVFGFYEKDSKLNDCLTFKVLRSTDANDPRLYVKAERDGVRLAYCVIEFFDTLEYTPTQKL